MRLVCDKSERYGQNGIDDIIRHDWFKGINFGTIRKTRPPYPPKISSEIDAQNFDVTS